MASLGSAWVGLAYKFFFVKNSRIFYFFLAFNIFSYVIIADSEKSKSEGKNVALPALLATVALKKNSCNRK
jgi:hypothetical protein